MALWVTFWGTRGSIPVSLDSASIRDKLAHAIVAASDKRLDTQEKARAWVDSELDFAVSHTFGGTTSWAFLFSPPPTSPETGFGFTAVTLISRKRFAANRTRPVSLCRLIASGPR